MSKIIQLEFPPAGTSDRDAADGRQIDPMSAKIPSAHRPSAYYFRQAVLAAKSPSRKAAIANHVIMEFERLDDWCRAQGLTPPAPRYILTNEIEAQGLNPQRAVGQ